jgi:hypothetical protein
MNPSRVFAVLVLLLAGALLVQGYVIPALFVAVFGVLVFVAPHVRAGGSNDEGAIGDAGASSWPSSGYDGSRCNDNDNGSNNGSSGQDRDAAACDPGDAGGDSGGDGGGDCGGGDSGGGSD